MGDDEWMPESLSALLGMQPDDPGGGSATSISGATTHIRETRAISERRALLIVENGQCDECSCKLGEPVNPEACECPCHCSCCCPPLFHCFESCQCQCECHHDPSESDDETDVDQEQPTDNLDAASASEQASPAQDEVVADSATSQDQDKTQSDAEEQKGRVRDEGGQSPGREDDDNAMDTSAHGQSEEEHVSDMSDEEEMKTGIENATKAADATNQTPGGQTTNSATHEDDGDDEMKGTAPLTANIEQLQVHQLVALLSKNLARPDEQAEINCKRVEAELFRKAYTTVLAGGKPAKTTNKHLPEMSTKEANLFHALLVTIVSELKYSTTRTISAIKDIVMATTRSTWSAEKIIDDRITSARLPRVPPTNAWKQPDDNQHQDVASGAISYRFDPAVYSAEEMERYKAVCIQEHVFGETMRVPTPDEWSVIMGLVTGSIQAAATPQFLKRCCTLAHITWMFENIQAAEGELWVRLPTTIKVFNQGQTTRRLAEAIRKNAVHQKWTDTRLADMLSTVKSIAYSKKLHSLHFYFFSKQDAERWENMLIPFTTAQFKLVNPETKLRRSHLLNIAGLPTDDDDGLVNDRYQAQFQLRLLNLARSISLRAVAAFLQKRTKNGLKSAVPLDTYGQFAEGSLTWDFYGFLTECPPELVGIYRIDWDGHIIILLHNPEAGEQLCLQCAQVGHHTSKCTTPEQEWNSTTLTVTAEEIRELTPPKQPWKTLDDVKKIFAQLEEQQPNPENEPPTPAPEPVGIAGDTKDGSSNKELTSERKDGASNEEPSPPAGNTNSTTSMSDKGTSQQETPNVDSDNTTTPGKTAPSKQGTGWQTASRNGSKKPKNTNTQEGGKQSKKNHTSANKPERPNGANAGKSQSEQRKPASPAVGSGTGRVHVNSYANLADSDDEEADNDDEDEKSDTKKDNTPPGKPTAGPAPKKVASDEHAENAAIEHAIRQAQLEQVRTDIRTTAEEGRPDFSLNHMSQAIAQARPNIGKKSSRGWLLEAINPFVRNWA